MQNSNTNELAKQLKAMRNPKLIGTSIGKVTKANPLTVSIADGLVVLTEGEDLSVCEKLKKKKYTAKFTWENGSLTANISGETASHEAVTGSVTGQTKGTEEGEITIDPEIKKGDMILVVPSADEQSWIAVDRIGE